MIFTERARYYNPNTGRFTQKDPIDFEGRDTNLYRYTGNDPINNTDPSGKKVPFQSRACDMLSKAEVCPKAAIKCYEGKTVADFINNTGACACENFGLNCEEKKKKENECDESSRN